MVSFCLDGFESFDAGVHLVDLTANQPADNRHNEDLKPDRDAESKPCVNDSFDCVHCNFFSVTNMNMMMTTRKTAEKNRVWSVISSPFPR